LRKALIAIVLIFGTGAVAAIANDAMTAPTPSPVPTAVPPSSPRPTAPGGRVLVPAPIDRLDIRVLESAPPRYMASITAGLPSGCAQRDSYTADRTGDVITIVVLNSMPPGNPICTMIYGTYELTVVLPGTFTRGTTYTVRANDRTMSFTAQ
jgi:hypothetical protein